MTPGRSLATTPVEIPLRYKLAGPFTLLMIVVAVALYSYMPGRLERQSMLSLQDKARTIARITAYTATPSVVFTDSIGLQEAMALAALDPDVVLITIRDAAGTVLGTYGHPAAGEHITETAPIEHLESRAGNVDVVLTTRTVREYGAQMRRRIALFTLVLFVVTVLLGFGVATLVTRPLSLVVDAAARIAAGGALTKVHVRTRNEVGRLADTFNIMITRLEQAHEELRVANVGLEDRVRERTAALEQEVRERQRADEERRASEERFRAVFEAAGIGIAVLDERMCIMDANHALAQMLPGLPLAGRDFVELLDAASTQPFEADRDAVLADPAQNVQSELVLDTATGTSRPVVCTISAVSDVSGKTFLIVLLKDLSEQRELEERYRQAQKLEAIGRLAGGVAHDFNNLLTTINGVTELLLEEAPQQQRTDLEDIRQAGERAAQLTRQLLAFSRRQVLQPEVIRLNDIATETTRMLRRIVGENITLDLQLDPALAPVLADSSQMVQVIMNLVVNSRDAMPSGGTVCIRTSMTELDVEDAVPLDLPPGDYVQIEIRDNGTGMDEATLSHAFEPFFTTKRLGEGTGLGLATVYGIVKQSGGAVSVESQLGTGTTFRIILPPIHAAPAESRADERQAPEMTGTILLVEDDAAVRSFVSRVLLKRQFEVTQASDGQEALDCFESIGRRVDVLLTDVVMPRMGGPELAAAIRQKQPDVGVIFMSGYTPEDVSQRDIFGAAARFIEKPMSADALLRIVDETLNASRQRS